MSHVSHDVAHGGEPPPAPHRHFALTDETGRPPVLEDAGVEAELVDEPPSRDWLMTIGVSAMVAVAVGISALTFAFGTDRLAEPNEPAPLVLEQSPINSATINDARAEEALARAQVALHQPTSATAQQPAPAEPSTAPDLSTASPDATAASPDATTEAPDVTAVPTASPVVPTDKPSSPVRPDDVPAGPPSGNDNPY